MPRSSLVIVRAVNYQGAGVGSFVLSVRATVADANTTIIYRLLTSSATFVIDERSGVIRTTAQLSPSTNYTV